MLKIYKIVLKECGIQVKIYGDIKAKNALAAIEKVSVFAKPYQEWIAKRMK